MSMHPHPSSRDARAAGGFGMVELLVAIAIGLFILLGLTTIFVNMRRTFTSQDQLAELQDSERLALTILTTTIQSAGYFPDPVADTRDSVLPASGSFIAGQGLIGTTGTDADSDRISSRYVTAPEAKDGLMNCLGETNTTGAQQIVLNAFSVEDNKLYCSLDGSDENRTVLVGNVQSMKILYGTDTAGTGNADKYIDAAAVQASNYWSSVRTARITLRFLNPVAGDNETVEWTQTINLMNKASK